MQDILLTDDLDLDFANGDFVIGESTSQHQKLLLIAQKGDFKQHPDTGVGAESYLNDDQPGLMTEIRSEFEKDGMKVITLQVNGSKIEIEAPYNSE